MFERCAALRPVVVVVAVVANARPETMGVCACTRERVEEYGLWKSETITSILFTLSTYDIHVVCFCFRMITGDAGVTNYEKQLKRAMNHEWSRVICNIQGVSRVNQTLRSKFAY